MPFGKYKGQPIEVLQQDPQYVEWLQGQDWVRERHQNLYTIIVNNFGEPDDTPEHNAIQARFLDSDFRWAFMRASDPRSFIRYDNNDSYYDISRPNFERDGWDVKFYANFEMDWGQRVIEMYYNNYVEIKPRMSDDFPGVLRQVLARRVDKTDGDHNSKERNHISVLIEEYTGVGATLDQVRDMFGSVKILLLSDVESMLGKE